MCMFLSSSLNIVAVVGLQYDMLVLLMALVQSVIHNTSKVLVSHREESISGYVGIIGLH
jgi:hypothetical protein